VDRYGGRLVPQAIEDRLSVGPNSQWPYAARRKWFFHSLALKAGECKASSRRGIFDVISREATKTMGPKYPPTKKINTTPTKNKSPFQPASKTFQHYRINCSPQGMVEEK
jgi:hypothetical protein